MPSLFTKLIAGQVPAEFVFQEPLFVAFLDISPANPGHVLLVPRAERQYLGDLPADTLAALGPSLVRLIACVKKATGAPAVNVLVNDGPEANQAVPHAHIHVIPRHAGDHRLTHPHGTAYRDGEMARMAAKLRAAWA
ncbi:MAG TPA: HIT family protein [Planctomycetota bacterium]|nr:HIT family protein [Planctomycetota bacterium]